MTATAKEILIEALKLDSTEISMLKTPQAEIDTINQRYKDAQQLAKGDRHDQIY